MKTNMGYELSVYVLQLKEKTTTDIGGITI